MYLGIYPEDQYFSCLICGIIAKLFLLIFYLAQNYMQNFHNSFYKKSLETSEYSEFNRKKYAFIAYSLRISYAFVLCFVYVLQYRSYWDTYNLFTEEIVYYYFFGLSLVTILAYRYILDGEFTSYNKTIPFELSIDDNHESYFLQGVYIKHKNVSYFCPDVSYL